MDDEDEVDDEDDEDDEDEEDQEDGGRGTIDQGMSRACCTRTTASPYAWCLSTAASGRCGALSRGQDGTRRRTEIRVKVGLQLLGRRSASGIGERRPDNLLDPPVVDINAWAEPHGGRPGGHRHASGPSRPDTSPLPSSTAHMIGRPLPLRDRRQLHHPDVAEREREKEKTRTEERRGGGIQK